jgi:hypothetical protein
MALAAVPPHSTGTFPVPKLVQSNVGSAPVHAATTARAAISS